MEHTIPPTCPGQQAQHQQEIHTSGQVAGVIQQRHQQHPGSGPGLYDNHGFGAPWMLQGSAPHGPPPHPWSHHPHHHHSHLHGHPQGVPMQPSIASPSHPGPLMSTFDPFYLQQSGQPNLQTLPPYHHLVAAPPPSGLPNSPPLYHPFSQQLHPLMSQPPAHPSPSSHMPTDRRLPVPLSGGPMVTPVSAPTMVNLPSIPTLPSPQTTQGTMPPFSSQLPDRHDPTTGMDNGAEHMYSTAGTTAPLSSNTASVSSLPSPGNHLPFPRNDMGPWRNGANGVSRQAGEDDTGLLQATSALHRRRNLAGRTHRHSMSRVNSAPQDGGDGDQDSDDDVGLTFAEHAFTGGQRHTADENELLRASQFLRGTVSTKMVASPSAISSLQSVPISELDENERHCVICYNEYGVQSPEGLNEAPLRIPVCRHVFGDHCIKKWFEDSDSCPYCRTKVPARPRAMTNPRALINFLRMQRGAVPSQLQALPDEILLRFVGGRGDDVGRRSPPSPGDDSSARRRARTRHSSGRSWASMMASSPSGVRPPSFMELSTPGVTPPPQQHTNLGQRDSRTSTGSTAPPSWSHQRRSSLGSRLSSSQNLPPTSVMTTSANGGRPSPHTRLASSSEGDAYVAVGLHPQAITSVPRQPHGFGHARQPSASARLPGLHPLTHPRQAPDVPTSVSMGSSGVFPGHGDVAPVSQDNEQLRARVAVTPTSSW